MEFGSLEQTSPHICCPPCNWWRARLLKVTLVVWVLVHTEIKKRECKLKLLLNPGQRESLFFPNPPLSLLGAVSSALFFSK